MLRWVSVTGGRGLKKQTKKKQTVYPSRGVRGTQTLHCLLKGVGMGVGFGMVGVGWDWLTKLLDY